MAYLTGYSCPMHPEIKSNKPGDCPICGMSLEPFVNENTNLEHHETSEMKWRFWLAAFLTFPILIAHMLPLDVHAYLSESTGLLLETIFATVVVWIAGWPLLKKMFKSYVSWQLNMFSLIGLGILVAYFYSIFNVALYFFTKNPEPLQALYFESCAMITTLVLLGQWLESRSIQQTTRDIEALIKLTPKFAHLILSQNQERKVSIEDIQKGDLLRVKPGEQVPADGVVVEGQSWVSEALLTGESIPAFKHRNDPVIGGTLNGNGSFVMEAEHIGKETLLAQMIQLVNKARMTKAPIQKMADIWSARLVPYVIAIALVTGFMWYFIAQSFPVAISHAVAVLIIACPCALGLATPLSMVVGIGLGAKNGIFIKNAEALESLEKVTTLVIDKTGTLTEGKPLLTKIFARSPYSEEEVLKFGASAESFSEHPVAESIVSAAHMKHISFPKGTDFQNIEGKGVIAYIDKTRVVLGNAKLMEDLNIDYLPLVSQAEIWQKDGQTVIFVAVDKRAAGLLSVADPLRFSAEKAIGQLHKQNLRIIMATGDSKEAAYAVGKKLHIDEIEAEFSPLQKMNLIETLQKKGQIIAMAGDGINDAPAITQANVGIAMGSGTEAAIQNASITLLKSDLLGVVKARVLSQGTMNNVRENLFFALIYNLIAIPFAAGLFYHWVSFSLTPVIASIAMALSSLSVVANALRLRYLNLLKH